MALLTPGSPAFAGIADAWFARSELGKEPTCTLFGTVASGPDQPMKVMVVWTASEGPLVWLNGSLSGTPAVVLESVGTQDRWDVKFDHLGEPGYAARHPVISASDIDKLIDDLGLGHELAITVTHPGQAPLRYVDEPGDRKVAVAMYRACLKSMIENPPPKYSQWPGMNLFQIADAGQCAYRQIFSDREFAPYITLWVDSTAGKLVFERETILATPHGKIQKRRKTPDRVNAATLFGKTFDLVEKYEYDLTREQVDALAADLSSGVARKVAMTSPEGETLILGFGGQYSRASAAMLAACRDVQFGKSEEH